MIKSEYNEPNEDEIIAALETAARDYFKCSLEEYVQRLDAHELPDEKEIIKDMMDSWLRAIPLTNVIFKSRQRQLSASTS